MPIIQTEIESRNFPKLESVRLDLVEIKQSHLEDVLNLFRDENVTKFYNLLPFRSEQDAQKFIDWYQIRFRDNLGLRWGISLKNKSNIIGTIGFNNFVKGHRANIGYDLKTEYWNHGYITEALKEVIDFGFNQLEINRIEAEVMQGNGISERVLKKLDFQKEGILKQWMFWNGNYYDMSMFALLKKNYNKK